MDPSIDFTALYREFDVALMGRRTFEMAEQGPGATIPGMQTVVCSRTLRPADHPGVTIAADAATAVGELKSRPGKDIWLFGGGALFRCLLDAGLVDVIELSIMPVLLSRGVPLLPAGGRSPQLKLIRSAITPAGIATLVYSVVHDPR